MRAGSELDWADLPNPLRGLMAPALRYGDLVLPAERDAVLRSMSDAERREMLRLAARVAEHRASLDTWIDTHAWSSEPVRRVCYLLELLQAIAPEPELATAAGIKRSAELCQILLDWPDFESGLRHTPGVLQIGPDSYRFATGHELTVAREQGKAVAAEVYLAAREDLDELSPSDREAARREVETLFEEVVAQIERELGVGERAIGPHGPEARWRRRAWLLRIGLWDFDEMAIMAVRLRLEQEL